MEVKSVKVLKCILLKWGEYEREKEGLMVYTWAIKYGKEKH